MKLSIKFMDHTTFIPAGHTGWTMEDSIIIINYPGYNRCIPLCHVKFYEFPINERSSIDD